MKTKQWMILVFGLLLSVAITYLMQQNTFAQNRISTSLIEENTELTQEIIGVLNDPVEIIKIYDSGKLIGIVTNYSKVEELLNRVYKSKFEQDFPNTKMGLGENIYISKELSTQSYENIDDQICNYLEENDQFSIMTNAIEFSDSNEVYATIYVRDVEDFNEAKSRYLLNFISEDTLENMVSNKTPAELKTYGRREISAKIMENITVSQALASPSKIMVDMESVFSYLCYGENAEPEIYVVEEFDMIEGVGSKKNGLTAQQLVAINPGKLDSVDQVLSPGEELNVRYFESPINVIVEQELIQKEDVYPETVRFEPNNELREGIQVVVQDEVLGSKNVKYKETWVNGVNTKGEEVSSIVTKQPVQQVIQYGTKVMPGIGTGTFRWPVDNPVVSCRWGCYAGHQATDIQNAYNRYGNLYAADRGTIAENTYHPINGYYMVINHNNGYTSYYGHMNQPGFYEVGTVVEKGEVIGQIGMTGKATGPHVHFVIFYNGERKNPCDGFLPC